MIKVMARKISSVVRQLAGSYFWIKSRLDLLFLFYCQRGLIDIFGPSFRVETGKSFLVLLLYLGYEIEESFESPKSPEAADTTAI